MSETNITPADLPAETPTLLAGKFATAAELEKGYQELERKLGERQSTPSTSEPPAEGASRAASDPAPVGTLECEAAAKEAAQAYVASIGAALAEVAGGEAEASAILAWAKANVLDATLADAYNAALESGSAKLAALAFRAVREAFEAENGVQGTRVSGEAVPATTGARGYESKAELVAVVRSEAYRRGDKAVHAEHQRRLQATSFNGLA